MTLTEETTTTITNIVAEEFNLEVVDSRALREKEMGIVRESLKECMGLSRRRETTRGIQEIEAGLRLVKIVLSQLSD